jgi:hypothetical protein
VAFTGEGLKNVLLVSQHDWHNDHALMHRLVNRAGGLDRSYFYFADLATPDLFGHIKARGITTVVGLGEPVLNRLMGEKDILRWRGRVLDMSGVKFIPTFAPHQLLPQNVSEAERARLKAQGITALVNPPRFQGCWMLDVEYALQVSRDGFTRHRGDYLVDPDAVTFERWVVAYFAALALNPGLYLSWDVETVYKQKKRDEDEYEEAESELKDGTLLRVSFSYIPGTGVSVPWEPQYLGTIARLLGSAGPKVVWNGRTFDVPVVEAVGQIVNGELFDYMDGWHVYQSDLPKGLEFVSSFTSDLLPWKHLNNSDPGLYSAIDADAALRNAYWIKAKLESIGQWPLYHNLYTRAMVPLSAATKRGNFIDIEKRDELRAELKMRIEAELAEIQPLIPRICKPRKVWVNPPVLGWEKLVWPVAHHKDVLESEGSDYDQVPFEEDVPVCSSCSRIATNKTAHFTGSKVPKLDADGVQLVDKKTGKLKFTAIKNPCKVAGGVIEQRLGTRYEYHEVEDFNPGSSQQMKVYARHFGHPIGTDARDSSKETMDKSHIKELIQKFGYAHPMYEKAADLAKMVKTAGTYIYDPDELGLIHQTYKNAPSTPRLSGANKNLMNVGKREDNYWAVRAREQIVARPGHRFVQADSSSIEAVIQGYLMGDMHYMKLATQGVHAWVVAKKMGVEWTGTPENVQFLKDNFKDQYNKMKTANYLTNFGGGPFLMWKTDRKSFPTKADAQRTQDELFAMLPKLKTYHHTVRSRAQKESYLEIPGWKFRHYYYDVFTTDQQGKIKYGKDSKRVVALGPQGCAALFLRENTLLLAYGQEAVAWLGLAPMPALGAGHMDWMPANFAVHDGYTLEVPDGCETEAAELLERVLTRPIKQLNNLRIGCEVDISPVGGNWGSYHEKKNPNGMKMVKAVRVPAFEEAA